LGERAARRSWFAPPAENWVTLENETPSYHARDILTDKQSLRQAARSANDKITWAHWQVPSSRAGPSHRGARLIKRLAALDVGYHRSPEVRWR
jgi:hypothetical protein